MGLGVAGYGWIGTGLVAAGLALWVFVVRGQRDRARLETKAARSDEKAAIAALKLSEAETRDEYLRAEDAIAQLARAVESHGEEMRRLTRVLADKEDAIRQLEQEVTDALAECLDPGVLADRLRQAVSEASDRVGRGAALSVVPGGVDAEEGDGATGGRGAHG